MRFVDLFAGIGGFHFALESLGHRCVFASELDPNLRDLYEKNFSMKCQGDITRIKAPEIPAHDILCAGFPCQSFSKAGAQEGLEDPRGNLFYHIARILRHHKPRFFILENVPNLRNHDKGRTWEIIHDTLERKLGYHVAEKKLSPHHFGTPQIRERLFIVGSRRGLDHFEWPEQVECVLDVRSVLDPNYQKSALLPPRERNALRLWQRFLEALPADASLPSSPIWAMEFGSNYPLDGLAPFHRKQTELDDYTGAFGRSLHATLRRDQLERLPKYARGKQKMKVFPSWKVAFIQSNRDFYYRYSQYIDPLLPEIERLPPSWQKFEWNCKGMQRNLFEGIIQFRGSGIRVKRPNYTPALIASTTTQRPIIGWEERYITAKEAARLQDLDELQLPSTEAAAFKALGNAVNARVVRLVASSLVNEDITIGRLSKKTVELRSS